MTNLQKAFESGQKVYTGEVGPPRGWENTEVHENGKLLKPWVVAANVTKFQAAKLRMDSLGGCLALLDVGMEPVMQETTRDGNELAIQGGFFTAHSRGVRNLVCMTGDFIGNGDHSQAKAVHAVNSIQLIRMAQNLNEGKDYMGKPLKGPPTEFFIGAVAAPEITNIEAELEKFENKCEAGAKYFQTQGVFRPNKFKFFMDSVAQYGVYVLAGILFLPSAVMAQRVSKYVAGINVPQPLIDRLNAAKQRASGDEDLEKQYQLEEGIKIAVEQVVELRELCHGVHVMAIGKEHVVPKILEKAGI